MQSTSWHFVTNLENSHQSTFLECAAQGLVRILVNSRLEPTIILIRQLFQKFYKSTVNVLDFASISRIHTLCNMVADLCHVVLSCFRGKKAKKRHAKTRQMVTFSCFRMAIFRPATQKYDTFHASPFASCLSYLCLAGRKVAKWKPAKITIWRVFVFSHGDLSPREAKIQQKGAKTRKVATRKPAKWWLFRVFAWRPFAPPGKDTTNRGEFRPARQRYDKQGRKRERSPRENPPNDDFFVFLHGDLSPRQAKMRQTRAKTRKVATRKPAKWWLFLVFAWWPFAPPGKDTTNRGENAKGRHAKTRQMMTFSCFRMVTVCPATRKYATFHALRFRLLFVVSLPGEAKGRHAKTRQNHLFCGFSCGNLSRCRPKNTFIRHDINQPPQCTDKRMHTMFVGPKLVQLPSHITLLTKAIPLVNDQHSN